MSKTGFLRIALLALLVLLVQGTWVLASTTGNIQGKVTDQNGNPVADARVSAQSPSQTAASSSGANGFYSILGLSPDTYTVTASKDGYDPSTVFGVTVQADYQATADVKMRQTIKTIGHVTTTAAASVVSRTITGDLYAVSSANMNKYQGAVGGAENLYSQNGVVGSLPGVVRLNLGSGGGYGGQGTLSLRGGSFDQVGFELDGIPLNRGFDAYNGTAGMTNGIGNLQVYTGGAPASEGRAMSGFISTTIARGRYPGGGDITASVGSPMFNHTVNADVYGGTPDNRFTYYISTLALNGYYNFVNSSNQANTAVVVPANDPGCNAFNAARSSAGAFGVTGSVPQLTGGGYLNCSVTNVLSQPQYLGVTGSTPVAAERDTVTNLNWNIAHNGLNDNLQMLYDVGTNVQAPFVVYGTINQDHSVSNVCCLTGFDGKALTWFTGSYYQGQINQPYDPAKLLTLTYPTAAGGQGEIPPTFADSNINQYSYEKIGYTRALSQTSFLRLFGYAGYSQYTTDAPINIGYWYQLHDNNTGANLTYQNQLNQSNLLTLTGDWNRDKTLRHLYINTSNQPTCLIPGAPPTDGPCSAPGQIVESIGSPFTHYSYTTPEDWAGALTDKLRVGDKLLFDLGVRYDIFGFQLMSQEGQITGTNGVAFQAEEKQGQCLHGFAYSPSDPTWPTSTGPQNCFSILTALGGKDAPGANAWQNSGSYYGLQYWSPRFGATFTADPSDVFRVSAGRYVQAPNSAFVQYGSDPTWGPAGLVGQLNEFYDLLGFGAVHPIKAQDSTNYDLSWEHDFRGGLSAKLTPFYRNTRDQILTLPPNPVNPSFVTGYNFGNAKISGVEFLVGKNLTAASGIGGTLAATYTNSKIRFSAPPGGLSNPINVINTNITNYNMYYGTNYAKLDPNGLYSPSYVQFAGNVSPSWDVRYVVNLNLDIREAGFDFYPTFNYQSGYPYGDPEQFADYHCAHTAGNPANAPGCIPLPAGKTAALGGIGPDPYTGVFDTYGAFKGPSWWTLNLGVSHDIGHNLKASILGTNLLAGIHNQGYAWEQPTNQLVTGYADNTNYSQVPYGIFIPAKPANAYYGDSYWGYANAGVLDQRSYIFQVTAKI